MPSSKIGVFLLLLTACDVQAQDATEAADAAKLVDDLRDPQIEPMERVLQRARWTGRPILAIVGGEWCGACTVLRKRLATDPLVVPLANQYLIYLMDVDSEEHARWRVRYPHQLWGVPIVYVILPDGRQAYCGLGAPTSFRLVEFLKLHLKKVRRVLAPAELEQVAAVERDMRLAMQQEDWALALRHLARTRRIAPPGKLNSDAAPAQAVDEMAKRLVAIGRSEVESARDSNESGARSP